MENAKRIADDFEDIRRHIKLEPIISNPHNAKCNCGHPENHAICDRWDCIINLPYNLIDPEDSEI